MRLRRIQAYSSIGLGIANLGVDLYKIDNGFGEGGGSGGVYVRGDVITTQSASTSRAGTAGGAGGTGVEGVPGGAGGASGEIAGQIGQSVFGNTVAAIGRDGSRLMSTGDGPGQLLETSANGFVSEDSELKGVQTADELNQGDYGYDDSGDGFQADFLN